MTPSSPARHGRALPVLIVLALVVVAILAGTAYFLAPRFESAPPQITLTPEAKAIGLAPIEVRLADAGAGLKSYKLTLTQGGTEHALAAEQLAKPVAEKSITIAPGKVQGLKEGPATLRISARDASLAGFFKGNEAVLERQLAIDLTPPVLELVADDRYVNFGGAGALVYKASPDTVASGVKFGDQVFPGYAGQVKGHPDYYIALFAHPYNVPANARPTLFATDAAGNTREMRVAYELKDVRYRKSTIALSDAFLQNKVAPLLADPAKRQGSPQEVFTAVNKDLRKDNEARITAVTSKGTATRQWDGAFAQLSNSKVEANFADERTYTYNGTPINTAYHVGYDLSVTKQIPIEAANAGTVVFTGDLGIYGNTVILDHGLGLFTLYSHLSSIDVKDGQAVTKRQILGKSGETGLAAGDHLHYGVYLAGVPVLPVEWWDQKWIDDNLAPKLEGRSGQEIAEAQSPRKAKAAAHKPAAKRKR
jgi:murein DD-endopeptidase MepM/ murein hydrolase activator NlpD